MRIGQRGTASDAFVQEVWFEGVPVSSVWYEGVKLYPDERTVVRDLVLEAPPELSYWVHACRAVSDGVSNARMVATIAGKRFHMGSGDGSLPVLREVGGAWRADESAGLLLQECLHQVVTVEAEVPERWFMLWSGDLLRSSAVENDFTSVILPAIDSGRKKTRFRYGAIGRSGASFVSSVSLEVAGGSVFFESREPVAMRGSFWFEMDVNASPVDAGENIIRFEHRAVKWFSRARDGSIIYPAFTRSWDIKVLGCTLQHRK